MKADGYGYDGWIDDYVGNLFRRKGSVIRNTKANREILAEWIRANWSNGERWIWDNGLPHDFLDMVDLDTLGRLELLAALIGAEGE